MYPTQNHISQLTAFAPRDDDDATIITSNCKARCKKVECANTITIAPTHAIADTGATSIFIMKGTPVKNLRRSSDPITISLPDGSKVTSIHICNISIPGLPTVLTGHIVPGITIASLIGIRILCKAGCKVIFDNEKCEVIYKNNTILRGYKDPTTNLWTLPIINEGIAKTTPKPVMPRPKSAHMMLSHQLPTPQRPGPCLGCAPRNPIVKIVQRNPIVKIVRFSYVWTTKINNVKIAHQSLCNPPVTSIIKAINVGLLNGAPHLNAQTVRKYLASSPATAKGHMKRPRKGIWSTTPKNATQTPNTHIIRTPQRVPDVTMPGLHPNNNKEEGTLTLPLHNPSTTSRMNPQPMYFALARLPTKYRALFTTIAREISRTCPWTGTYVSS